MRTHYDSSGRALTEGAEVAFNRSGDVIRGKIVGLGADIRIDPLPPARRNYSGQPSRVRHGRSTLVLDA